MAGPSTIGEISYGNRDPYDHTVGQRLLAVCGACRACASCVVARISRGRRGERGRAARQSGGGMWRAAILRRPRGMPLASSTHLFDDTLCKRIAYSRIMWLKMSVY